MNPGRQRRRRQLALLTGAVLAAHLALLSPAPPVLAPPSQDVHPRFATRSITPPAPPPPAATPLPAPPPRKPVASARAPSGNPPEPLPPPAAATPWPDTLAAWPSAVLHYTLEVRTRGTSEGEARLSWRHAAGRYEAQLELSVPGRRPRVQQSTGAVGPQGLVPERFSDRTRSEQATHFEPDAGRVVFSSNQPQAAWVAGMQDRLSVLVQLAMLAAADPARLAPGVQVAIPTATTRDADAWMFHVVGTETLALPGGTVDALKFERPPRREYDQRVELWLAPGQAYAPVRLRLTNPDGGWVDQRWSSTDRPGTRPHLN